MLGAVLVLTKLAILHMVKMLCKNSILTAILGRKKFYAVFSRHYLKFN